MSSIAQKQLARIKRKVRVRKKVVGITGRPRLNVFKSARHIYAQLIDDTAGVTLASASTLDSAFQGADIYTGNVKAAAQVGLTIAKVALEKGIKTVSFDRNGFLYHGRIKALADAAREAGLVF